MLDPRDIRTIALWLSPEYVMPAAAAHGQGDPVAGARGAYDEVRGLLRSYARFVRVREKSASVSLELAQALRAMGYVGRFQACFPVEGEPWRDTALRFWPNGTGLTNGWTAPIPVGTAKPSQVYGAVLGSLGSFFERYPALNRAVLQGRLYQRVSPEIMVHTEPAGIQGARSYVLDPTKNVRAAMRRARKAIVQAEQSPFRDVGFQLLQAWSRVGLITTSAACMVSFAGIRGHATLVPMNGIPVAIQVGPIVDETVTLYATLDHRVWDGSADALLYAFLEEEVKRRCG